MAKPIEDEGHVARATKPLQFRVYEEEKPPCPVQNRGAFINVVNRSNNASLYVAHSDGSRWRRGGHGKVELL